jgi:hypothetical protein
MGARAPAVLTAPPGPAIHAAPRIAPPGPSGPHRSADPAPHRPRLAGARPRPRGRGLCLPTGGPARRARRRRTPRSGPFRWPHPPPDRAHARHGRLRSPAAPSPRRPRGRAAWQAPAIPGSRLPFPRLHLVRGPHTARGPRVTCGAGVHPKRSEHVSTCERRVGCPLQPTTSSAQAAPGQAGFLRWGATNNPLHACYGNAMRRALTSACQVPHGSGSIYCRAIAMRIASSGETRWSALPASVGWVALCNPPLQARKLHRDTPAFCGGLQRTTHPTRATAKQCGGRLRRPARSVPTLDRFTAAPSRCELHPPARQHGPRSRPRRQSRAARP